MNVNVELKWCDDLLLWNTSDQPCFNKRNRSEIFLTPNEIWTPDIVAINGPGKSDRGVKYQYPVLVICTGSVRWSYQEKLVSYCQIDVKNFPFDRQYCSILLQSTIYDTNELKLRSLYRVIQLYNFINTEWTITHVTIEEVDLFNPHYDRNFSTLKINIELVRLSRFYVLKIILPFSIISSLGLFSFCLPTDTGERITLTVSVLLSLTIYIQHISDHVPKSERGLCILTLFSNTIFLLVFLSCIFNVLTIFIYYHERYMTHPKNPSKEKQTCLHNIHKSLLNLSQHRWLLFKTCSNVNESISEENDENARAVLHDIRHIRNLLMSLEIQEKFSNLYQNVVYKKHSVKKLAEFVDRILFLIYLILMPICFVISFKPYQQTHMLPSNTNQLLDLRKTAGDPLAIFRGCPS